MILVELLDLGHVGGDDFMLVEEPSLAHQDEKEVSAVALIVVRYLDGFAGSVVHPEVARDLLE